MTFSGAIPAMGLEYIFRGGAYTREDAFLLSDSLLHDAARVLCEELLFTDEQSLHRVTLESIHDDFMNITEGYSFLSDPGNDLSNADWACDIQTNILRKPGMMPEKVVLLNCLQETSSLLPHLEQAAQGAIKQYEKSVNDFLEHLILLILFSGGQPDGNLNGSDGVVSDLVSLRFANRSDILRHVTLAEGLVIITTPDRLGHPDQAARIRILPRHIGNMIVLYLANVRPFLAKLLPHHPAVSSEYLFPTTHGHWQADFYSMLIHRESLSRLGKALTLEDINPVHLRFLEMTNPEMLTPEMWDRITTDNRDQQRPVMQPISQLSSFEPSFEPSFSLPRSPSPPASGNSLPSSTDAMKTLNSSGLPPLLPFDGHFAYPIPMVSPGPATPSSFCSSTTIFEDFNVAVSSPGPNIAGLGPELLIQSSLPECGSITRLAFIDGYAPKSARSNTSSPMPSEKKKSKREKRKDFAHTLTKKSSKIAKAVRRRGKV